MELDEDTIARLRRFCGRDPREPETVTREVLNEYGYGDTWTLAEFRDMIDSAIEAIPPEYRDQAIVKLGSDYSDESSTLKITYDGMQTTEEVNQRLQWCLGHVRDEQERERRTYESLKAKYEPNA